MIRLIAAFVLAATPVAAIELHLPAGARLLSERVIGFDNYAMPVGSFRDGARPTETFEGKVARRTWRIDNPDLTTLQIMAPIRTQIEEAGFQTRYICKDLDCSGFDFRFGTEITPAPDMYVDIRNFRYTAAEDGNGEALSVLVSKSRTAAFIQTIEVVPLAPDAPDPELPSNIETGVADPVPEGDRVTTLANEGHVVLRDLEFETGADALGAGPYETLVDLAAYLTENPSARIALVGHTDSVGGLAGNIDLSRRRANAVRTRLIETYGIEPARLEAEGVGYLAPVASNLTAKGREDNRRVEAVLLSAE